MKRYLLAFLVTFLPAVAVAQTNPAVQAARAWRQQHERAIVDEFITLLSIPNIASDRENIQRNATDVTISVSDDGQGIPADQHKHIFEKFGQTDSGALLAHSTGLGLAFCRLAVEAHEGKIGVQSEPGKGSTFSFTLPMNRALTTVPEVNRSKLLTS